MWHNSQYSLRQCRLYYYYCYYFYFILFYFLQLVLCTSIKHKNMFLHPQHFSSAFLGMTLFCIMNMHSHKWLLRLWMQDDDNGWNREWLANVTPTFRRIPNPVKPMQREDECVILIDLRNCLPSLGRPEGAVVSFFLEFLQSEDLYIRRKTSVQRFTQPGNKVWCTRAICSIFINPCSVFL